jgi:polyribonucleotide nucleotidyltransferase
MGLVSDEVNGETRYAALTDILGAEDALGDMDFKVAGTSEFITAIQLDTKLDGIPASVLTGALTQAKEARTAILAVINAAIDGPDEMAATAPRVISVQIPVDKIGELIGPKGKTINTIQDETGATISIEDDGTVYIGATDGPSAEAARAQVNAIANPTNPEVGEQFLGTVVKLATFGALKTFSLLARRFSSRSPRSMTVASFRLSPFSKVKRAKQPQKATLSKSHSRLVPVPLRWGGHSSYGGHFKARSGDNFRLLVDLWSVVTLP